MALPDKNCAHICNLWWTQRVRKFCTQNSSKYWN